MKFISELENSDFLNSDNLYGTVLVYDEALSEMARVGKIPDTTLEIHIKGGEGNIPHMHICKKSGKNIVLRISLVKNEYFREKDDIKNTLNSSERKALDSYLKKIIPYRNTTQWDYIIDTWNQYNPSHIVNPKKVNQPNYTTINEPK